MCRDKESEAPVHSEGETSLPENAMLLAKGTSSQPNDGGMQFYLAIQTGTGIKKLQQLYQVLPDISATACIQKETLPSETF